MKRMKVFFGEYYLYLEGNEEERKTAETYLQLWKHNLLNKLCKDTYSAKLIDEHYINRASEYLDMLSMQAMLSLRICVEIEFKFEVEPFAIHEGQK